MIIICTYIVYYHHLQVDPNQQTASHCETIMEEIRRNIIASLGDKLSNDAPLFGLLFDIWVDDDTVSDLELAGVDIYLASDGINFARDLETCK